MIKYEGYQLKITNTIDGVTHELTLPFIDENTNIIENGSYNTIKENKIASEWVDIIGNTHREVIGTKTSISFTIKEHTAEQHERLIPLLNNNSRISVKYWDDAKMKYDTNWFYISEIESTSSIASLDTIYYGKMSVRLTEY